MKSPFPGMDPFIEADGPWGDFHDTLITKIKESVSDRLPERYVALTDERAYVEYVVPDEERHGRRNIVPDVGLWSWFPQGFPTREAREQQSAIAVATEPDTYEMCGLIETENREIYLDIWELDPEKKLVTSIEVLSPTNKKFADVGWQMYERKRQIFFQGHANLVEIDLLRGGQRHMMQKRWPDSPYTILTLRREQAPHCQVRAAFSLKPLPDLTVPLAPPDADIIVPLQPLVDDVYRRSRYHRLIHYDADPSPLLTAAEAAHLEAWKKEKAAAAASPSKMT